MSKFEHYWLCGTCARERGGVWPEGHVATVMLATCKYCNGKNQKEGEAVIPWVDFNWQDSATTRAARAGRD